MTQEKRSPSRVVIVGLEDSDLLARMKDVLTEAMPGCVVLVSGKDNVPVQEDRLPAALEMLLQRIDIGAIVPALIEAGPDEWLFMLATPMVVESNTPENSYREPPAPRFQHIHRNPCKQRAPPLPGLGQMLPSVLCHQSRVSIMHFELIRSIPGAKRSILRISEAEARNQLRSSSRDEDASIKSLVANPFGYLVGSDGLVRFNDLEDSESEEDPE